MKKIIGIFFCLSDYSLSEVQVIMAQNGMFRSAMGGFNKQDVLQYIDEITAAWNMERQALEQQVAAGVAAQQELMAANAAAANAAESAIQRAQVAEAQLSETQQQVYDATADLAKSRAAADELAAQLEEALRRAAQLEAAVTAANTQRDDAIAAVADARAQLESRDAATAELAECRETCRRQEEQITAMQQAISRYEQVLGDAETAQQRVDSIVRPFIEQANRQADDTLDSVQAVLAGVLAQLGELQGSVDQRRQALRRCRADSDSRLSAAFGDWLGHSGDTPPAAPSRRFFR